MGIEHVPSVTELPPAHARVKVVACGICGSDLHYYTAGRIGKYVVESPMVLGHESAGVVTELAASGDTRGLKVGDRVALEPGVPCGACPRCDEGRYNLCAEVKFFATPPVNGSLATEVVHPAAFCHKIPEGLRCEHGALCEPLSVAVHAVGSTRPARTRATPSRSLARDPSACSRASWPQATAARWSPWT